MGGCMLRQGVAVASGFDQLPALHQCLQPLGQLLTFASAQVHLADELFESCRAVRLAFDVA